MITATGRFISGGITETGRIGSVVTETGEYAPSSVFSGGAVAGGSAAIATVCVVIALGGAIAGGSAEAYGFNSYDIAGSGGAVSGGAASIGTQSAVTGSGGPIAGGAGSPRGIFPVKEVPSSWISSASPGNPGGAGSWGDAPAPSIPAPTLPALVQGVASYAVVMAGLDVTGLCSSVSIDEAESAALSSFSLQLPVGVDVSQGDAVTITWSGTTYNFIVEELSATGPNREVWGRSSACVLDAPHAATGSWNGWDNPYATASALASFLAGSVAVSWQCSNWSLPPVWNLSGTPLEAIQALAGAVGAIVQSTPSGSLIVRRRWPVRPPAMPSAAASVTVSRDTALSISAKKDSGEGWGEVTVYGYDPAADLPALEVEESSPLVGDDVHVRLYWQRNPPPDYTHFITDGGAVLLGSVSAIIANEEVTFDQGKATTRYPMDELNGYTWLGVNQGAVARMEAGASRDLAMMNPDGRGIALVTYTTSYQRWLLTGQSASKVIFGVNVGAGAIAARVVLSSGGSVAPAISSPLLYSNSVCVEAGTAALDEARARTTVSVDLPLTAASLVPGVTVAVSDPVTGLSGKGKIVRSVVSLTPEPKTMRSIEVQVCS